MLVTTDETPAGLVTGVVRELFEHAKAISAEVPEAGQLDPLTAILTAPIHLHPGAVAFYREFRGRGSKGFMDVLR